MNYFVEICLAFLIFLFSLYHYFHEKSSIAYNWPIVGMFPKLLINLQNIHDYLTEVLEKNQLTFVFKGPWLTDMMNVLVTADPANVQYIMCKNLANYPKGPQYSEIFDALGDGIFNTNFQMWGFHRKMAQSFLYHPKFYQFLLKIVEEKIENGLLPILDHVSSQGIEIDLQDLFGRLSFDITCAITMDFDPKSLSIGLPSVPPSKALLDLEETFYYRHTIPSFIWKFQRWLSIGQEKKHKQACKILDDFIYNCIAIKRSQNMSNNSTNNEVGLDLLSLHMNENKKNNEPLNKIIDDTKFFKDVVLNYLVAAKGAVSITLSWFFYLLSENPKVESKIREELERVMNEIQDYSKNSRKLCRKLVYLHASFCESLRLYPTLPFQHKSPVETDILPSGHKVNPNMKILIHVYTMARMKSIWGDDCCEFKPERWISAQGNIKYEPPYKFLSFNAGPRACPGKDTAFTQLKITAAAILRNYRIEAVKGFPVVPSHSIHFHMKHPFKVKVVRLQ